MYHGGQGEHKQREIAAFSERLQTDKERGWSHLQSCACVVSAFAHIHRQFLGEACMYTNS
jgi:hypothetical protein